MPSDVQVASFLGLEDASQKKGRSVNVEHGDVSMLIALIRTGLPHSSFVVLKKSLDVPEKDLARIVSISARTLSRREVRFKPDESDRIVRVARIMVTAMDVLGSESKARHWLRNPNRALGNVNPLDLLDTDTGAQVVLGELARIEHGIVG